VGEPSIKPCLSHEIEFDDPWPVGGGRKGGKGDGIIGMWGGDVGEREIRGRGGREGG